MKFLKDLDFTREEIDSVNLYSPDRVIKIVENLPEVVTANITFLKDLGVTNYKEAFVKHCGMFIIDPSVFQNIFIRYDKADLISKIAKNVEIIDHL